MDEAIFEHNTQTLRHTRHSPEWQIHDESTDRKTGDRPDRTLYLKTTEEDGKGRGEEVERGGKQKRIAGCTCVHRTLKGP